MSETTPSAQSSETRKSRLRPESLIEYLAVAVMLVMMLHVTANALLRTIWDAPLQNTLEITQYWYMPIIAFLGFIAAQSRGQHIAADLIYERLPDVIKRYVLLVVFVLIAAVSAYFAWFSWGEALHAFDIKKVAGVSDLPAWPTYFLAPLAFAVLTVQFLYAGVRSFTHGESHLVTDVDDLIAQEAFEEMAEKQP